MAYFNLFNLSAALKMKIYPIFLNVLTDTVVIIEGLTLIKNLNSISKFLKMETYSVIVSKFRFEY